MSEPNCDHLADDEATSQRGESPTKSFVPHSQPVASTPHPLPRQLGRFELIQQIGAGGFGCVYLARDSRLERQVAIKILRADRWQGPDDIDRFLREARAAAILSHPHICPVYDVGEFDQTHYLVMRYVGGPTLKTLTIRDRLPVTAVAARIVSQVARAIGHAHSHGIIHRDIKPANVLLENGDVPIVTDFGLAMRLDSLQWDETAGIIAGTPPYMAPEQLRGVATIGAAADIYSLGVTLYELLTGRRPFPGTTLPEVLATLPSRNLVPPSAHCPDLDQRLNDMCCRALADSPRDRFQSMSEFADALDQHLTLRDTESVSGVYFTHRHPAVSTSHTDGNSPASQIRSVLTDAHRPDDPAAVQSPTSLSADAAKQGCFDVAREKLRRAIPRASGTEQIELKLSLARFCIQGGARHWPEAERLLNECAQANEVQSLEQLPIRVAHLQALLARYRGQLDLADRWLCETRIPPSIADDRDLMAERSHYQGLIAASRGQPATAEHCFLHAVQYAEPASHRAGEIWDSLAGSLLLQGETRAAIAACKKSLASKRAIHDRYGEAITLGTLGRVCVRCGLYRDAQTAFERDLQIAEQLNDFIGISIMLNSLGDVAWRRQELSVAADWFQRSIRFNESPLHQWLAWLGMARVHYANRQFQKAEDAAMHAADWAQDAQAPDGLGPSIAGLLAAIEYQTDSTKDPTATLETAAFALRTLGYSFESAMLLIALRDVYLTKKQLAPAIHCTHHLLQITTELGGIPCIDAAIRTWPESVELPAFLPELLRFNISKSVTRELLDAGLPPVRQQKIGALSARIQNLDSLQHQLDLHNFAEVIADFVDLVARTAEQFGGAVERCGGDEVLCVFGVLKSTAEISDSVQQTAHKLCERFRRQAARNKILGQPAIVVGIGVASGEMAIHHATHLPSLFPSMFGNVISRAAHLAASVTVTDGCEIMSDFA